MIPLLIEIGILVTAGIFCLIKTYKMTDSILATILYGIYILLIILIVSIFVWTNFS